MTNGPQGAFGIPPFSRSTFGPSTTTGGLQLAARTTTCCSGSSSCLLILFHLLENSRVGRAWTAIREDEVAAEASGIPTVKYKLMAFAIGASTSGFAGVLYASKVGFINPDNFPLLLSILVLVLVIFGGMGSMPGVVLGAAVLQWLPQLLRGKVAAAGPLHLLRRPAHRDDDLPAAGPAPVAATCPRDRALPRHGIGGADAMGAPPGSRRHDHAAVAAGRTPGPILEVDDVTLRFGGLTSLDDVVSISRRAARSCRSSAPTAPARPRCSTA